MHACLLGEALAQRGSSAGREGIAHAVNYLCGVAVDMTHEDLIHAVTGKEFAQLVCVPFEASTVVGGDFPLEVFGWNVEEDKLAGRAGFGQFAFEEAQVAAVDANVFARVEANETAAAVVEGKARPAVHGFEGREIHAFATFMIAWDAEDGDGIGGL